MGLQAIASEVAELLDPVAQSSHLTLAIYDRHCHMVAAAGDDKHKAPLSQGSGSPVAHVLGTGLNLVVDKARGHELCQACPLAAECTLAVEIYTPVIADQECVGALAAFCWDPDDSRDLLVKRALVLQLMRQVARAVALRLASGYATDRVVALETSLRYVLDLSREPAVVVDPDQRVIAANSRAAALLNCPPEKWRLRPLAEIVPPAVAHAVGRLGKHRGLDEGGHHWEIRPIMAMEQVQGTVILIRTLGEQGQRKHQTSHRSGLDEIRGASEAMAAVKAKVRRIAPTEATVLIRGESGTGKELFARAVHWESNRRDGPFVALNCAAIPETLLESELFGYEDGAFTGARKGGKPGKFQLASGGTLLLDEVGDLPSYLQAKLLRVLQFKEVERVGGTEPISVDFRLIAATNRPLEEMIAAGTFREDLYYRLNVIPLELPPLRVRKEDITLLLEFFTKRLAHRDGYRPKRWSAEALNAIYAYHWPGNVRELENAVEHAASVEDTDLIAAANLPRRILTTLSSAPGGAEPAPAPASAAPLIGPSPALAPPGSDEGLDAQANEKLAEKPDEKTAEIVVEKPGAKTSEKAADFGPEAAALVGALDRFGRTTQGKERAARWLGISRATLYRRMKLLGVS